MSIMNRGGNQDIQEKESDELPASQAPSGNGRNERSNPQAILGNTIIIKGKLCGEEDLTIEGRIEGQINLKNHNLVVGQGGNISADVVAKSITVVGRLEGNLNAEERVEIKKSGSLTGDVRAPRVVIEDGAKFKGSVDMNAEALPTENKEPPQYDVKTQNRKIVAKQIDAGEAIVAGEPK